MSFKTYEQVQPRLGRWPPQEPDATAYPEQLTAAQAFALVSLDPTRGPIFRPTES